MKSWAYASLWALAVLAGCSGDKAGKRPATEAEPIGNQPTARESIRPPRDKNEKVKELDLNRDYKPDVWLYTVEDKGPDGQPRERKVRKEIDFNGDGRVDITQYFNEREEKVRETMDQDFDGKVDSTLLYEKGVNVRTERDVDGNGRTDVWLYYEKGKLARKERDTNGDGKVDNWEYWENGQVDRIGDDLDSDGNVDRWTKNPNAQ
ncbi:hypothetical protein [Hyalangium versicolor]|uniref:hypothetical protein n=1 Tax=Hyalangium versicolor TaxID=2861190 RepID=UPI001CC9EA31|nr:hypothetical protein [Hyalangium versicolor]